VIRRTAHPPTDPAISLVEESGRVQRVANFPVARDPLVMGHRQLRQTRRFLTNNGTSQISFAQGSFCHT
jgi:hypothetical protein